MSGRIRPNSNKITTHPKRERRRQRAAERLAEWEKLTPGEKMERGRANHQRYLAQRYLSNKDLAQGAD